MWHRGGLVTRGDGGGREGWWHDVQFSGQSLGKLRA